MTGHRPTITGVKPTKDGKLKRVPVYHDASAAIRAKKSKKVRVMKRGAPT